MKLLLTLLFSLFSFSALAQIDIGIPGGNHQQNKMKMQIAQKNAEYNGAIVGYAKACGVNETEYNQIETLLFKNFKTVEFGDSEMSILKSTYSSNVNSAKERSNSMTKVECSLFIEEFKKIISIINTNN